MVSSCDHLGVQNIYLSLFFASLLIYLYLFLQGVRKQRVVYQDTLNTRVAADGKTRVRASELGPHTKAQQ